MVRLSKKEIARLADKELHDAFLEAEGERIFTIQFLSPTAFKRQGEYLFYPDIYCLFRSLMNKHDQVINGVMKWNLDKKDDFGIGSILRNADSRFKNNDTVYNRHLKELILHFSKNEHVNENVKRLRSAEENARNKAAHTVTSVTEETILDWTEETPQSILALMKTMAAAAGMLRGFEAEKVWNSYDEMNKRIVNILDACML